MKKRMLLIAFFCSIVLLACQSPTGAPNSSSLLVGRWGLDGSVGYEFTADGKFITGDPSFFSVTYSYTAANGNGQYWLPAYPDGKATFTYSATEASLDLVLYSSVSIHLTRVN